MRARFGGGLVFLALAAGSVVACTLIVDGETKDLTGTCTPTGANDNACGKCALQHCQTAINASCAANDIGNLERCVQDPSPTQSSGEWGCTGLLDDASVHQSGISQQQADLRSCVAGHCMTECTVCTDVKPGPGACGACIIDPTNGCGGLLNKLNGCCGVGSIQQDITACTASVNPDCSSFRDTYASALDSGVDGAAPVFRSCSDFSSDEFAKCFVEKCGGSCPQ
jgi:hypothetical protein